MKHNCLKETIKQLKESKAKFMKDYKRYHNQYVELDKEFEKIRLIVCSDCETNFYFDLDTTECPVCGKPIEKSLISKCLEFSEKINKLDSEVKQAFIKAFNFSEAILDTPLLKKLSADGIGVPIYMFFKNIELLEYIK